MEAPKLPWGPKDLWSSKLNGTDLSRVRVDVGIICYGCDSPHNTSWNLRWNTITAVVSHSTVVTLSVTAVLATLVGNARLPLRVAVQLPYETRCRGGRLMVRTTGAGFSYRRWWRGDIDGGASKTTTTSLAGGVRTG